MTVNNSTACQDDPWQGRPFLAFGPGKDGHLRILQHRYRDLSERASELSRRRYEASVGPKADHVLLTRLGGERAQVELELNHIAAARGISRARSDIGSMVEQGS